MNAAAVAMRKTPHPTPQTVARRRDNLAHAVREPHCCLCLGEAIGDGILSYRLGNRAQEFHFPLCIECLSDAANPSAAAAMTGAVERRFASEMFGSHGS